MGVTALPPDPTDEKRRTMPISPEDATTKEVLYPDDLPGETLEIDQYDYWQADDPDDAEDLPDDAQFGLWLPVKNGSEGVQWASAPRSLREQLQGLEAEDGFIFQVHEAEKGPGDHDPWHIQVDEWTEGDPL